MAGITTHASGIFIWWEKIFARPWENDSSQLRKYTKKDNERHRLLTCSNIRCYVIIGIQISECFPQRDVRSYIEYKILRLWCEVYRTKFCVYRDILGIQKLNKLSNVHIHQLFETLIFFARVLVMVGFRLKMSS